MIADHTCLIDKTHSGRHKIKWIVMAGLVLFNIFGAYPSTLPFLLPLPNVKLFTLAFLLFYVAVLFHYREVRKLPKLFTQIVVCQMIGWGLFYVIHRDGVYITRLTYVINAYLALLCLYQYKDGIIRFVCCYNKLILAMAICGTAAFFLVLLNILPPLKEYYNIDGRVGYFYGLTCTIAKNFNIIRYSGFFDEPGAMAAWGVYAIVLNRIIRGSRKIEDILIATLFFTFSMAYYIQLLLFVVMFRIKTLKQSLRIIFFSTLIIVGLLRYIDTDGIIYRATVERFEMDDSGELKGDNRSKMAVKAKSYFLKSPLIGNGPTYIQEVDYLGDNPYESLASDGIIGTIIMYLPLIIISFPFDKRIFGLVIILMVGYLQRPFHCHLIHFLLMYVFVLSVILYKIESYGKHKNQSYGSNHIVQCG